MRAPTFQPKGSSIGSHLPGLRLWVLLVVLGASPLACHTSPAPEFKSATPTSSVVVRNARLPGGAPIEVLIVGGLVAEVGPSIPTNTSESIDANGRYLVPGVIDSHVHLAYLPVGEAMVKAGIAGAVDLAAPLPLRASAKGLDLLSAGPMLTAIGGYPTRSWGQDGYGLEVDSKPGIDEALDRLQGAGARLVKFSLGAGPDLDEELLQYLVTEAKRRDLLVAVHALSDADAATAARLGADILAHTPIQPMSNETVQLWSNRAVISTLTAFGSTQATKDNLLALRDAGATILYGTDLGNTREAGISCPEIVAMQSAGLANEEILRAMTAAPAELFGFSGLGSITPGNKARLLLLDDDPLLDAQALCRPSLVISNE